MTKNSILGLPVEGYRPQTQSAVDQVNVHKILEEKLLRVIDDLQSRDVGEIDMR